MTLRPQTLCPFLVALATACGAPQEESLTPAAHRLAAALDAMHVERLWLAGHDVNWRTGEPTGGPAESRRPKEHTHCSAFVAAASARLGVPMLEPPEHSQLLLADAQCAWLAGPGREQGWQPVATPLEAQRLANRGNFVLACYETRDPAHPGHIAVVRPAALDRQRIESEGPEVTQAGDENYASASLAQGFAHHPDAWGRRQVRFFFHPLPHG